MNNDTIRMEVYGILMAMEPAEALKRLSPTGSGAMTCCGGREAGDQQGSAEDEERSDETGGLARCAGEGEADKLRRLAARWKAMAASMSEDGREACQMGYHLKSARCEAMAQAVRMCASDLLVRLPKPDSVALKERSGRRNAGSLLP